jgi:hypothetical protein
VRAQEEEDALETTAGVRPVLRGYGIVNADGTGAQTVPNTSDGVDPDLD